MAILPLILEKVTFQAGKRTPIDTVSCTLKTGSKTVILGPNGAGKSLLLRLCHGLLGPSSGNVRWAGGDANTDGRHQAMVFQQPVMLRRSVRANVAYGLKLRRTPPHARPARINEALERTGLIARADQHAPTLSTGEQQRLALARAWALEPEILFLDEPTASLDPGATGAVEAVINDMAAGGTKIVMATHDLAQARRIADDVLFLYNGRLTEHCAAEEFFASPNSKEAAAFLDGKLLW